MFRSDGSLKQMKYPNLDMYASINKIANALVNINTAEADFWNNECLQKRNNGT